MCYTTFQEIQMLVTDIVKFFIFLIVVATMGSALEKDLCESDMGDTSVMQSDWGGCSDED